MTDDFSRYPPSITEAKAKKSNSAKDATPRDTLIEILRKLDAGEIAPTALIVIYATADADGDERNEACTSSPNRLYTKGMLIDMLGAMS